MANLPKNAHVSTHPCLQAKLSQLRSTSTPSKDVPTLVHEIATMVGYEALASGLTAKEDGNVSHAISSSIPKQTAEHPRRIINTLTPPSIYPQQHQLCTPTTHIIHAMHAIHALCTTLTDATPGLLSPWLPIHHNHHLSLAL